MEDSYTVHRRRKAAAAKRRDKTPEIISNVDINEEHDDDDGKKAEDKRMRMEQMVEDTEKMEENIYDGRAKSPRPVSIPKEIQTEKDKSKEEHGQTDENNLSVNKQRVENDNVDKCKNRIDVPPTKTTRKVNKRRSNKQLHEKYKHSSESSIAEDDDKSSDSSEKRKRINKKLELNKTTSKMINKKQIIPIDNDSLIEELKKFQKQFDKREISILDHDIDDQLLIKPEVRRRKKSRISKEIESIRNDNEEINQVEELEDKKPDKVKWKFWSWFSSFRTSKEKVISKEEIIKDETIIKAKDLHSDKTTLITDVRKEFRVFVKQNPGEVELLRKWRNRCFVELILMVIFCGLGAFLFRFTEGAFETFYKCGVKRVKRDFLDSLWNYSHNLREDDWKSMARKKLMDFEEQLHTAHEAGVHSYSGQKSWSFLNSFVYCLTVVTTIGYGHISPSTTTGRAMTIIYAIFGIPMFLIILADFGKLFTRGIKFLWAFVRRVYYTGSCRRARKTARVQEVMKGVQLVYDFATFRRPSQMTPEDIEEMKKQQSVLNLDGNVPIQPPPETPATPETPALSAFEIDDEFNLPISVAITVLLIYIFVGATFFNLWEQWGFFESFYFVFISMSTIGFGDFVPKHPIYMMCSIVYLVFGLALTSMCINVVQVMLSDSFKHATQKIGATIGFEIAEEDGSIQQIGDGSGAVAPSIEVAEIHTTIPEENEDQHLKIPKD